MTEPTPVRTTESLLQELEDELNRPRNKQPSKSPKALDPDLMVGNASFYLRANRKLQQKRAGTPASDTFMAGIVCAALSAELSLKAMLVANAVPYNRIHDLFRLYRKLPTHCKQLIHWSLERKRVDFAQNDTYFQLRLYTVKDGFQYWRYFHETTEGFNVPIDFMNTICEVFYHIASLEIARSNNGGRGLRHRNDRAWYRRPPSVY